MKKLNLFRALFAFSTCLTIFFIYGCKKESVAPVAKQVTTTSDPALDSATYLKGYLGTEPVKFEGNTFSYSGYINPDSNQNQGGHNPYGNGNGNGQDQDNDAYFMSGSKWVNLNAAGLQTINASVEVRSLAVRVFVSPIDAGNSVYYHLLVLGSYPVATDNNPGSGAYVSLHDSQGVLWTTHGDQDGSSLTITSIGAANGNSTTVTGTVSCKMYDGNGNVKQLTGATFTTALGI